MLKFLLEVALAIFLVVAFSLQSAQAATITKAGNSTAINTGSSWVGGAIPASGDIGLFDSTITGTLTTSNMGADLTVGGFQLTNPGGSVTIGTGSSRTLTLNGSSTITYLIDMGNAAQDLTIGAGGTLRLASNAIYAQSSGGFLVAAGRTLTINATLTNQGNNKTLKLDGGGNIVLNGVSGGGAAPFGFSILGGSTVTMNNSNSWGGTSSKEVVNGTLNIGNDSALGTVTLALGNGSLTSVNPTIAATGGARTIANNITLAAVTTGNAIIAGSNDLTVNGVLLNSGSNRVLTVSNTGLTTFGTGGVALSESASNRTLTINGAGNTTISGAVTNGSGGATLANLTYNGTGLLTLSNASNTFGGTLSVSSGAVSLTGGLTTASVSTSSTGNFTESSAGVISGSGTLTQGSSGTSILAGNNTYSGTTTLTGGTLAAGNDGALGTSTISFNGGTLSADGGARNLSNAVGFSASTGIAGIIGGTNALTLNGTFTTNGNTLTVNNGGLTTISGLVNLSSNATARTLTVGGTGNVTISGLIGNGAAATGGLTYSGTGILSLSNAANTYNGTTTISSGTVNVTGALGNTAIDVNGGTLSLQNAGAVSQNTLTVSGGNLTETVTNALSGTASLTASSGTATLSNANNYTGQTTISGTGSVVLANANAAQNSTVSLGVNNGLGFGSGITAATVGALSGSANLTLTNTDTNGVALTVGNGNGSATYSGVISGSGSLTKNGTGTQTLNGASSTYTGGIALNSGALSLGNSNAAGNASSTITAATGTTILANSGLVGNGTAAGIVLSGTNANVTLQNNNTSGGINSAISGSADQTLTISNAGGTVVNLNASTKQLQNFYGTVSIVSGQGLAFRATSLSDGSDNALFVVDGGLSTRNGGAVALGALSGSGSIGMGTAGGNNTALTYTIGARGTNTDFSGSIHDGDAATGKVVNVIKTGSATQTFSGNNTYTGTTTLTGGTLSVGTIGDGGVSSNLGAATNAAANLVFNGGTLQYTGADATSDRAFTINAGKIATIYTANNLSFAGATGTATSGALTKTGAGTLTLIGTNTYNGTTTISTGTLQIGNGTDAGSIGSTSTITNNGTLIYNVGSGNRTLNAAISGTGVLAQNSAGGILTLTANNTYSGKTAVQNGTISFNSGNASAAETQALGTNAAVDLGVAGTSSGTLLYTGATGTLAKAINILGNGGDTIQNSGTGLLTLSGTLTKNGTVLNLKGGSSGINVTGAIAGAAANSDLVVSGGTVTLSAANTYNGPTSVNSGATLTLGINNAIPSGSAVTLGDATTTGTLNMGSYSDAITSLAFGAGNGTLKMAANQTGSAQLSASGTVALGTTNTLDLTGMGTSAGVYKLVRASGGLTGTFITVTGMDNAYSLKYGTLTPNELDVQHKATISLALGSNAASVHVGSQTVNLSIGNTAPSSSADLNYTLGGVTGSGTRAAQVTSAGTGTYTASAGVNSFSITATDSDATNSGSVAFSQTGYNLAAANATQTVNVGNMHVGGTKTAAVTLSNTAPTDATYTETLASNGFSGTSANFSAAGAVSGIAGGSSGNGTLLVGLGSGLSAGAASGTTTLALNSNAVNGSGLGTTVLSAQTITITGQVYSGQGVWNTNGGGSYGTLANMSNWTTLGGAPGLDSGFASSDTATFGSALTGGTATVNLNGAAPSLAGITFNNAAGSYILANGSVTLNNGGSAASLTNSSGSHTISADVILASNLAASVSANATLAVTGAISGSNKTLDKTGAGTLTLSGNNTYSGTTTVSAGELVVNGSIASPSVTVGANATLGGTGTIAGDTTIAGTHNPGNSPGIQTIDGNLTYSGGSSVVNWELSSNTNVNAANPNAIFDTVVVAGNLSFNGLTELNLSFKPVGGNVIWSDPFWQTSRTGTDGWLIYDVAGSVFNFSNLNLIAANWQDSGGSFFNTVLGNSTFSLYQGGSSIFLNYTTSTVTTPEPSSGVAMAVVALLGSVFFLVRRCTRQATDFL